MKKAITPLTALPPTGMGAVDKAWDAVSVSFDRFCLTAGIEALGTMMEQDAEQACGARHARSDGRRGHRWGRTQGKIGFHAGKVAVERPRVRDLEGHELALPSWERAVAEDWLGKWAMNLMLINVSTRKFRRAVRLPEGDVPAPAGAGVSKSAASRHFVALSAARMKEWMGADLSGLDIMVVQIDGIHISEHLVLVAALGIDGNGVKHRSGGPRRDPHRHATRPAKGTSPRARMHQHRGECHEHSASRLPQREAMAIGLDGPALDRGGHAGSRKRLPTIEGAQATSGHSVK